MAGAQAGGYRLSELGELAGGIDYAAVGQTVSRFGRGVEKERGLRGKVTEIETKMSNVDSAEKVAS